MNVLCIIPARGGSKRIPLKNLLKVGGLPLVGHSIGHALNSRRVTHTIVSTDSPDISEFAQSMGAQVIDRPIELSGDTMSSESTLLHTLDVWRDANGKDPDLVVFLQCTSPVRYKDDIDRAIDVFLDTKADSLFSACDNKRLIWHRNSDGKIDSLTYDFETRRREQEMQKQYYENGSIYVFPPELLRKTGNRLGGKIEVYEMDIWTSFQLDDYADMKLLDWVLRKPEYAKQADWPQNIDLVVFDFDGVITDNTVIVTENGEESVRCNRSDGLGLDNLRAAKVPALILSTETNKVVRARANKLQLPCLHGQKNKAAALTNWLEDNGIPAANVVYLGNDRNDLGCLQMVGMPVVVANSHPSVLQEAKLILSNNGGDGAVRELCDLILEIKNRDQN